MDHSLFSVYSAISTLLAAVDFYFGYKAFQKTEEIGRYLGMAGFAAGAVNLSYLFSVSTPVYSKASAASSIYFICIDWLLVILTHFVYLFTETHMVRSTARIRRLIRAYAIFDTIIFLINIYREIAVHYTWRDTAFAFYEYEMKPLYIMHLVFTYLLVALILFILITKYIRTPGEYRSQYGYIIAAIVLVVLVNGIFLYPTTNTVYILLDYSILGYSFGLYFMYWAAFDYRINDMLRALSMTIFQNIDQGIVLFDYTEKLIMHNNRAARLLGEIEFVEKMPCQDFLSACQIQPQKHTEDFYSIQIEHKGKDGQPLRCDFRRLKNSRGRTIGNLFVFTDVSNDTDLLTGFQHWVNFRKYAVENPEKFLHPTTIVIFDIVGLGEINRTFGREVGDQRIRKLVKIIQNSMPKDTLFVRGYEAHLVAICSGFREEELRQTVEEIIASCNGTVIYGMGATSMPLDKKSGSQKESGLSGIPSTIEEDETRNVFDAVHLASRSLMEKKLITYTSVHSQALTSLVRALQESDSDTEAHVQRTQKMGVMLANRIGLSDVQIADLSLLCLLHDIGKIGIPLEILNKPGKLTEAEWDVLRTHPEKGYQIAMTSDELKAIAPMILYHHERWDGKGYPEKLSGQNIPVLSRIISIVDAYDAMVNDRAYRKGMAPEKAQKEIRRHAGTQFDPYLADEFLLLLEENPNMAKGEKTGAKAIRVFRQAALAEAESGNTAAVAYSKYLLDLDDMIIDVDNAFEEITGFAAEDVVGKMSQFDLIPQEDLGFYMVQVNNQFTHGSIAYLEHDIVRKDKTLLRVTCCGKRYYDSAAKAFRSEIIIARKQ